MVQTYGVARTADDREASGAGEETSRLLDDDRGEAGVHSKNAPQGHASMASCIGNLTNTIIGSGTLQFPRLYQILRDANRHAHIPNGLTIILLAGTLG